MSRNTQHTADPRYLSPLYSSVLHTLQSSHQFVFSWLSSGFCWNGYWMPGRDGNEHSFILSPESLLPLVFFDSSFLLNQVFQASSKASFLRVPLTLSPLTLPIYASLVTKKYYIILYKYYLTLKCFNPPMWICAAPCGRKTSPKSLYLSIWPNFIYLDGRIQRFYVSEDFAKITLFFSLVHAQSRDSDHKQPLNAIVTFYKFSEMEEEKLVRKCQDLS